MEITADEITEGDVLLDYGTAGHVYRDLDEDGPFVVVQVSRREYTFRPNENVQVTR